MSKSELDQMIRRENLNGLIGKTHMMILEQISENERPPQEIFEKIKGKHEVSSFTQVMRAIDQLKRIDCVVVAGERVADQGSSDFGSRREPIYKISDLGRTLLGELKRQQP